MRFYFIILMLLISQHAFSQGEALPPPPPPEPINLQIDESLMNEAQKGSPNKAALGYKGEILEGFYEEFFYNSEDRRDPFSPWQPKINFSPVPITNPLQKFALDQLLVVAIISNVGDPKALILDPSGTSHIVTENTRIGNSNGYVAKIREGEVVVVEEHYDIEGNKVYQTKILLFKRK